MSDLKDLLGVVSGLIALLAAWISYRVQTRGPTPTIKTRVVVRLKDDSVDLQYWTMKKYLRVISGSLMVGALLSIPSQFIFPRFIGALGPLPFDWITPIASLAVAVSLYLVAPFCERFVTPREYSRGRRSLSIELATDTAEAMQRTLDAFMSVGVDIGVIDPDRRTIAGRFGTLVTSPRLVNARVTSVEDAKSIVEITCDSVILWSKGDLGASGRLARRIANRLLAV